MLPIDLAWFVSAPLSAYFPVKRMGRGAKKGGYVLIARANFVQKIRHPRCWVTRFFASDRYP